MQQPEYKVLHTQVRVKAMQNPGDVAAMLRLKTWNRLRALGQSTATAG